MSKDNEERARVLLLLHELAEGKLAQCKCTGSRVTTGQMCFGCEVKDVLDKAEARGAVRMRERAVAYVQEHVDCARKPILREILEVIRDKIRALAAEEG